MAKGGFERLNDIARAYQPARMLLTAGELGLFDHLEESASAAAVARALKANERALTILLDGLSALKLIHKEGGLYRNGQDVSAYLVSNKPDYRGAIFRHQAQCWHGWSELTETVKSGHGPAQERRGRHRDQRAFILGMQAVARDLAPRLAARLPLPESGRLLDVGGGPGTYCMAFCRQRPALSCTLFDLPETLKIAREVLAAEGAEVASRIRLKAGDFTTDELGSGQYEFVWLSQVLHAYPEQACAALIGKAAAALRPGGVAAVHEFALSPDRTRPQRAALFSVHMLAVTAGGRAYSRGEIAGWLRQAGLAGVRSFKASPASTVILAHRP